MTKKSIICLLLCVCVLLSLAGCGEAQMSQQQMFAMDTSITLTAYGKNRDRGLRAASSVIQSIDVACDPELETSTVYSINHAQGQRVVISGQLADMLSCAQTVYTRSEGAYDPSIYPLVKRWGFVDNKYYLPSDVEIAEDLARLCFGSLVLTSFNTAGTYAVSIPSYGMITLASCAKGAAAKHAVDAMKQQSVKSGIVSMGGNVQTLGLKPDGTKWLVGVQDPNNPTSYLGVLTVGETAVVTSGAYQRRFTATNGKSYHHLLNPQTGYPVSNNLLSVTIICEDGTMADCLSTAMYILGSTKALKYWRTYGGFDMILVYSDNSVVCTSGLIEEFNLSSKYYTLSFTE